MPALANIRTKRDVQIYINTMVTSVDIVSRPVLLNWLHDEMEKILSQEYHSYACRRGAKAVLAAVDKEQNRESARLSNL